MKSQSPLEDNFDNTIVIRSVADVLSVVAPRFKNGKVKSDRRHPLYPILNKERVGSRERISKHPLGVSESKTPRPFSQGLWFRGHQDRGCPVIPSAHQIFQSDEHTFDEKNAFLDMKLRMDRADLSRLNSFELLCKMRHHGFPARILDWSSNPLIGLYFAVSSKPGAKDVANDGVFTCINAYRLNELSCLTSNPDPGLFYPDSANVAIRALMSEHTKLIDVVERMKRILESENSKYNKRVSDLAVDLSIIEAILTRKEANFEKDWQDLLDRPDIYLGGVCRDSVGDEAQELAKARKEILKIVRRELSENPSRLSISEYGDENVVRIASELVKLAYPVAVVPKRDTQRMTAQLSMFTLHGGKRLREEEYDGDPEVYDSLERTLLEEELLWTSKRLCVGVEDDLAKSKIQDIVNKEVTSKICSNLSNFDSDSKIFRPVSLDTLNAASQSKFMIHFVVDKKSKEKIREELDLMSINGSSIFPELDNQVSYVTDRWTNLLSG